MTIQVAVFWIVIPYDDVGYRFKLHPGNKQCCPHLRPEDGGSIVLRRLDILHITTRYHNSEDRDLKTHFVHACRISAVQLLGLHYK